jgi:hypothetical protein
LLLRNRRKNNACSIGTLGDVFSTRSVML